MKTKPRDVIDLRWEGDPLYLSVRGHVHFDAAYNDLLAFYSGNSYYQELLVAAFDKAHFAHVWARWSCEAWSECDHVLQLYAEPGRCRFTVTAFSCSPGNEFYHGV